MFKLVIQPGGIRFFKVQNSTSKELTDLNYHVINVDVYFCQVFEEMYWSEITYF